MGRYQPVLITMTFDSIFINGDSYSVKAKQEVYGNHLGAMTGVPVENRACVGSSNDRITRTTIEGVTKFLNQSRHPLVIVGWSFIRRCEVWYYGDQDLEFCDQDLNPGSKLITLDFLLQQNTATPEQRLSLPPDHEIHKKLVDFYLQVYLLANWLEKNNLPYFFFSAADNTDCDINCFPYIDQLLITNWCRANSSIYRLHDFCLLGWAKQNDPDAGSFGHLSLTGHRDFAKFLHTLLEKRYGMA
jgi:hypothetical protein